MGHKAADLLLAQGCLLPPTPLVEAIGPHRHRAGIGRGSVVGGIAQAHVRNTAKANLLYNEIDRNPLFKGTAAAEDRSHMNACFLLNDEAAHQARFDALWKEAGVVGINGHRSVGGYRASMYNALPLESVQVLVDCMRELERTA